MIKVIFFFLGLLGFLPLQGNAQVKITAEQTPLIQLLQELNRSHDLQYSLSNEIATECAISIQANFADLAEALHQILQACELGYEYIGGIYVVSKKKAQPVQTAVCVFEGRLIDAKSGQALSNVVVRYQGGSTLSDENGYFSVKTASNPDPVRFSHIAYQNIDTVLASNQNHTLPLQPKEWDLAVVMIEDWFSRDSSYLGLEIVQAIKAQKLQAGIYLSQEELLQNQPSLPWIENSKRRKSYRLNHLIAYNTYRLRMPFRYKVNLSTVWGFCDGENIYINVFPHPRNLFDVEFARLHLVGPYLYYEFLYNNDFFLETDLRGSEQWVIDLNKEESMELDKYFIGNKIAKKKELYAAFENEWLKKYSLGRFLFRFYETPYPYE